MDTPRKERTHATGKAARRKGHDWEREVARRFGAVFGEDRVHRGLQYRTGAECPDVICPGFWIECKRGHQTCPKGALRQASQDSEGKGVWPIAVCKNDCKPAHVTMALDDFLELVGEWHAFKAQTTAAATLDG